MVAESEVAAAAYQESETVLAGRAEEEGRLRASLNAALAGRGTLALISGEAGIGKTALTRAVGWAARERGALVLTGRCYDLTETPPYGPWADLAAWLPTPDDPMLAPAALFSPTATAQRVSQLDLFARFSELLLALTSRQPLVIILDDLHWTDPASLELLRFLAARLQHLPILIVATYRDDELRRTHPLYHFLPLIVRELSPLRLELHRLTHGAIRALVRGRYPLPPADEVRLVTYLEEHAGGNPLYLGEVLRALAEAGTLTLVQTRWQLGDLGGVLVPSLLAQVIEGRAARLGEGARELLVQAAVIGQEVPRELWAAVSGVDDDTIDEVIERAGEARLLEETPDGLRVSFCHALIREVLYQSLSAARRRIWHQRIGGALLATAAPDPDAVASHLLRAGDERAATWLIRAGERGYQTYAWLSAAERFEAAFDLLDARGAAPGERALLLFRLARLRRYADPEWGIEALGRAVRLAVEAGDRELEAQTLYARGLQRCYIADLRRGIEGMTAAIPLLDQLLAERGQVRDAEMSSPDFGATVYANSYDWRDTLAAWLAEAGYCQEVIATLQLDPVTLAPPDRPLNPEAYQALAMLNALRGRPAAAREAFAAAQTAYDRAGHHFLVCISGSYELEWLLLNYGLEAVAERRLRAVEAEQAARRAAGAGQAHTPTRGSSLPLLLHEGLWDELCQVAPITATLGPSYRIYVAATLGPVARARGQLAEAWGYVREALPTGPATAPGGGNFLRGQLLQRLAFGLALDAGDLPLARTWLAAHDRWLAWNGASLGRAAGLIGWAAYRRATGDLAQAQQLALQARELAREPRHPGELLASERLLGELATIDGRHEDAATHFAAALALAESTAAPYARALTLLALAELCGLTGAIGRARNLLDEVVAIGRPLGAAPLCARADALRAGLTEAAVPAPPRPAVRLTRREDEVLRLIASGESNPAIAARLGVSLRTVERHITNLYAKIDARGKADATAYALRHNLH